MGINKHSPQGGNQNKSMFETLLRRKASSQILDLLDVYIEWVTKRHSEVVAVRHNEYLRDFIEQSEATLVRKITLEEVINYLHSIDRMQTHSLYRIDAMRSLRSFFRYVRARGYPAVDPKMIR